MLLPNENHQIEKKEPMISSNWWWKCINKFQNGKQMNLLHIVINCGMISKINYYSCFFWLHAKTSQIAQSMNFAGRKRRLINQFNHRITWDMEPNTIVRSFIIGISRGSSMSQSYFGQEKKGLMVEHKVNHTIVVHNEKKKLKPSRYLLLQNGNLQHLPPPFLLP